MKWTDVTSEIEKSRLVLMSSDENTNYFIIKQGYKIYINLLLFDTKIWFFFGMYYLFYHLKGIYFLKRSKNAFLANLTLKTNFHKKRLAESSSKISLNKGKLMGVYVLCNSKLICH